MVTLIVYVCSPQLKVILFWSQHKQIIFLVEKKAVSEMKSLLTMILKKASWLKLKFGIGNWYQQKGLTCLMKKKILVSEIFPWNYIVAKNIF